MARDATFRGEIRGAALRLAASLAVAALGAFPALGQGAVPAALPADGPELVVLLAAAAPPPEGLVDAINQGRSALAGRADLPVRARLGLARRATGPARLALAADPASPRARLERYVVLTCPDRAALEKVRAALAGDPRVEAVGENVRGAYSVAPADPLFSPPASGDPTAYQWGSQALHLPEAWSRVQGHAYVGLLDVGLMTDHPDLRAFHVENGTLHYDGGNFRPQFSWNYDHLSYGPDADEMGPGGLVAVAGHGTHTSGIIAATPNNSLGVAGACWHCSLMMARDRILPANEIAEAFTALTDHGAQVINYSGFIRIPGDKTCSNLDPTQDAGVQMICDALAYADARDVVFTISAGNDLGDVNFPARDPRVLAVGGLEPGPAFWRETVCPSERGVSGFLGTTECGSNYTATPGRRMLDLVAPAKGVLSTMYTGRDWSPDLGCGDHFPQGRGAPDPTPGYGTCTGTSMAAPYVAAIAGLLRSANPLLGKADVRTLLLEHADHAGAWSDRLGYGIPDAAAAVAAALGTARGSVLPNRLTPLFGFYSEAARDSFATTVPQMAVAALTGTLNATCDPQLGGACTTPPTRVPYAPTGPPVPGYPRFPGLSCAPGPCSQTPSASVYVFTAEAAPAAGAPPLVPLFRMSFKDRMPGSLHRDVTYATRVADVTTVKGWGYDLDGIEGYVYAPCTPEPGCIPAGAVRLYLGYHPERRDFAIFPQSELAEKASQGYTVPGYGLDEVLGYVYPNVDSDGDRLIDGFELLVGTSPTRADSDCDGRTDGQEVLDFPYSDPLGPPGCSGPPTARFTFRCSRLGCAFDAGGSTGGRGIATYTWSFGDGRSGSGVAPSHAYAAPGSYRVTLTVADSSGATAAASRLVAVVGAPALPALSFFTVKPCRLLDTRRGSPLTSGRTRTVKAARACGIPSTAKALSVTVTAVSPTGAGRIALLSGSQPSAPSSIAGGVPFALATSPRSNGAVVALSATGTLGVAATVAGAGTVHALLDVDGYWSGDAQPAPAAAGPLGFQPLSLCRAVAPTALVSGVVRTFTLKGTCGIAADAAAVSARVGVDSPKGGSLVLYSSALPTPETTSLSFATGARSVRNGVRIALKSSPPDLAARYLTTGPQGSAVNAFLDVDGIFRRGAPFKLHLLTPCRAVDTTNPVAGGPALADSTVRTFQIQGNCGVPVGAAAAFLQLTVSGPTASGDLTVYPASAVPPALATLAFDAGEPLLALGTVVPLAGGTLSDLAVGARVPGGTLHLAVDVLGYFDTLP